MKTSVLYGAAALLLFCTACQKESISENLSTPVTSSSSTAFVQYVIPKGEHYAIGNDYKPVDVSELKFVVRFDSSCIYQTTSADNQWDVNKLYGFSDNNAFHQQFSARLGWLWNDGALRIFAYTYNNAVRDFKEIAAIAIGSEVHCSIKVTSDAYVFTVGKTIVSMPRLSTTPTAKGYQLYPYFGGDEVAPHEVHIWVREEK